MATTKSKYGVFEIREARGNYFQIFKNNVHVWNVKQTEDFIGENTAEIFGDAVEILQKMLLVRKAFMWHETTCDGKTIVAVYKKDRFCIPVGIQIMQDKETKEICFFAKIKESRVHRQDVHGYGYDVVFKNFVASNDVMKFYNQNGL